MALITTGSQLIRDLEKTGALGVYIPLEGGHEGRYQRRIRAAGYALSVMSAKGLGDLSAYLLNVHGVRPPHLGKKTTGQEAAVGYRYFIPPILTYQLEHLPPKSKGLCLWLLEGNILSNQEVEFLAGLPQLNSRIKIVVEMGGERYFRWESLKQAIAAA